MYDFVSPSQAAKILGVSQQWVTQLIRDGKLRAIRVGQRWIIVRLVVERLRYEREQEKARKENLGQ